MEKDLLDFQDGVGSLILQRISDTGSQSVSGLAGQWYIFLGFSIKSFQFVFFDIKILPYTIHCYTHRPQIFPQHTLAKQGTLQ